MIPQPENPTLLRTDTPEEQLIHYPIISARRNYRPWDDRAAWTANRYQVNSITVAEVRGSVSTKVADYATADEKAVAVAELNAVWLETAKAVRAANKAAKAVFPLSWTRATHAAYLDAYEALTPEHRALVSFARDLRDARHELYEVAKWLQRYGTVKCGSVRGFEDLLGDTCPTFTAITARIAAAGEKAAAEYVARIQSLPVDDAAWARELAGREERETWFRNGPIAWHEPASAEVTW